MGAVVCTMTPGLQRQRQSVQKPGILPALNVQGEDAAERVSCAFFQHPDDRVRRVEAHAAGEVAVNAGPTERPLEGLEGRHDLSSDTTVL